MFPGAPSSYPMAAATGLSSQDQSSYPMQIDTNNTPTVSNAATTAAANQQRFFPSMPLPSLPASSSNGVHEARELHIVWQGHWTEPNPDRMDEDTTTSSSSSSSSNSRMNSREYKLRVHSIEELYEKVHEHFPTESGQPIQLTDEEQRPLTPSSFAKLKDADVVLVFEAAPGAETSIVHQWSKSFEHIPHPSIVTYSQELLAVSENQPAIAYALAEFVDNSISALRKYRVQHHNQVGQDGQIRIIFMQQTRGQDTWTIVIEDDGCGMTKETLEAFSRMGDAPQYRGEQREAVEPDATNNYLNVNISQWGIGAKSAGFFLGNNIIVSSRSPSLRQVLECAMSQQRMFRAHQETGNAFNDELRRRQMGDVAAYPQQPMHPYMAHLIRQETGKEHFTRIAVTGIEERHFVHLQTEIPKIAEELANIYNRFLHGPLGRETKDVTNATKLWLRPNLTVEHVTAEPSNGQPWRMVQRTDLREMEENDASQYQLLHRGPVFRFELNVNAPPSDTHSTQLVSQSSQAKVLGEIYYFPRSVDGETHPELRRRKEAREARGTHDEEGNEIQSGRKQPRTAANQTRNQTPTPTAAAAQALAKNPAAAALLQRGERLDADGNIIQDEDRLDTFDVYWHGRLIPLSHVNKLGFMKFTPETKDCFQRMKGFLFFSFPFLTSRNKLTFAERNLQAYLTDPSKVPSENMRMLDEHGNPIQRISTASNRVGEQWKKTLLCWKALDANYTWQEKYYLKRESEEQGKDLYSQVTISGAGSPDFKVLKQGGLYKLKTPSVKKPEWVEALYFEREKLTGQAVIDELVESEHGGSGKIWYVPMPKTAQQPKPLGKSLRLIDKDTPLSVQHQEYLGHQAVVMSGEPHHIQVWMEPRTELKDGSVFRKTAGYFFPGTAVAVFGHPAGGQSKVLGKDEKIQCEIRYFTKDFPQEDGDTEMRDADARPSRGPKIKKSNSATARPAKRPRLDSDDDEPLAAATNRSRTARPKQVRRASTRMRDTDEADESKSGEDDDEEESNSDNDAEGVFTPFRGTAPSMSRDVMHALQAGERLQIHSDVAPAASTTVATTSGSKKRKNAVQSELGRQGFEGYFFNNSHALGHYSITFNIPDWTIEGRMIRRDFIPSVKCDIYLTPALPVKVELNTAVDSIPELVLGVQDTPQKVGFHLTDNWNNVWDWKNLRGEMDACGIRITSITTNIPELTAQCNPVLQWSKEYKHWSVADLRLAIPPVPSDVEKSSLPFNLASDRLDVAIKLKFDVNNLGDDQRRYVFDPPPRQDHIKRLKEIDATFHVKLGPGPPTDFICELIPDELTLTNGEEIKGLAMHLADQWHHRTAGQIGMEIITSPMMAFLPSAPSFTPDHDVLTSTGWKLIHQVQVGDLVWSMRDPAAGNTSQDWCVVSQVVQTPLADGAILHHFDSKYYSWLTSSPVEIEGVTSEEVRREPNQKIVYTLVTANKNFYVRRHSNKHRWTGIFTGPHERALIPFPLPSMTETKVNDIDELGQVLFDPIPVNLSPAMFASHCVEVVEGIPLVEFSLVVQIRFKDQGSVHPVKTMKVTVKPRWGPVALRLFPDGTHLQNPKQKIPLDDAPLKLSGRANDELTSLHVGFVHESGHLIPISELQKGIGMRQKQLQFSLDGLDGARTQFTLADLRPDGHLDSGLNLPTIIGSAKATAAAGAKKPDIAEDGLPKTMLCHIRMSVDESVEIPSEESKSDNDEDVEMSDAAAPDAAPSAARVKEKKPPLSTWLPYTALSTPFEISVAPGPPKRWNILTAFPRGFKCGLMWNEHLQIGLVDEFGNRTLIPETEVPIELEMNVYCSPPNALSIVSIPEAPAAPAAAVAPVPMSDIDIPLPSQASLAANSSAASSSQVSSSADAAADISTVPMDIEIPPALTPAPQESSVVTYNSQVLSHVPSPAKAPAPAAAAASPSSSELVNSIKNFHPSRPPLQNGGLASWYTSPTAFLVAKAGVYWIVAKDKHGCFQPSAPLQVQIIGGSPHRIRAFTNPSFSPESEVGYDSSDAGAFDTANPIRTASKGKIGRLFCKFYDRGGNETVSHQTVELQLVLPKEAPSIPLPVSTPPAAPAAASSSVSSTKKEDGGAAANVKSIDHPLVDKTVSGIYTYPLAATQSERKSIFAAPNNNVEAVKSEFPPLPNLTGVPKQIDTPAAAHVVLEEFTLHLNAQHMIGSTLLIQAREVKTPANAAASAGKKKTTVKNDISIPLEVKPFDQAVDAIEITTAFDADRMSQALHSTAADLALKPTLVVPPPTARSVRMAQGKCVAESTRPVPAGTPFPPLRVKARTGELAALVPVKPSPSQPDTSQMDIDTPVVKREPGLDDPSFTRPWLLPGFSIEVYHIPAGDISRRQAIKNLYHEPRYDAKTDEFVFDPIHADALNDGHPAASYVAPNDYVFNAIGDWLFLVRFSEPREAVANVTLPNEWEKFAQFTQRVIAGPPKNLTIDPRPTGDILAGNVDRTTLLASPSAAGFQPRASRTIASNLRIKLLDQFGNEVKFENLSDDALNALNGLQWKLTGVAERAVTVPAPAPASTSGREPIIIIDSDDEDEMVVTPTPTVIPAAPAPNTPPQIVVTPPTLDMASSSLVFSDITIAANSTGDSGKYCLEFHLSFPFSGFREQLFFYFSNDQAQLDVHLEMVRKRRAVIDVAQKKYDAKLAEIIALQGAQQKLEDDHARAQDQVHQQELKLQQLVESLSRVGVQLSPSCATSASQLREALLERRHDLRHQQSAARAASMPAKIDQSRRDLPPVTRADGYHGRIAQLASIADSKICTLVSWHCASFLNTFVTSDRSCVADREIRRFCQQHKYGQVLDLQGMNRSTFDPSILPHHQIRNRNEQYQPRGHPRYIASCFDFPNATSEHERNQYFQLLQSMCGRTMVCDSMDDAVAYRQYLVEHGQQCPTILCLKELKALQSNNIERFDSSAYARGLNSLSAHFEIRPAGAGMSGRDLKDQTELVDATIDLVPPIEAAQRAAQEQLRTIDYDQRSRSLVMRLSERQNELTRLKNELSGYGVSINSVNGTSVHRPIRNSGPLISAPTLEQQSELNDQERRRAHTAANIAETRRQTEEENRRRERVNQPDSDARPAAAAAATYRQPPPAPRPLAIRGGRRG